MISAFSCSVHKIITKIAEDGRARPARDAGDDLGQLEHDVAAVAYDPGADLHELLAVVSDHRAIVSGSVRLRRKLARLSAR